MVFFQPFADFFAPALKGAKSVYLFSIDDLFEARFFSTRRGGLGKEKNFMNC